MAAASKAGLEGELDRLYQLPLSEFTSARDDLSKRLRADGAGERAQEVKKLRKPTAVVWLVNQLAGESSPFSEARRDEHRALEQLAKATREIAERAAIGPSAVARATDTLRAASLTAEGRDLLRRGRLTEELEPPGFEALTGLDAVARPARAEKKPPRSDDAAEKQAALKLARERVRQLRAKERELATAARAAEREAKRAEAEAEVARSRAAEAEERARAISEQREAAQADLDRLR
jgi:hypothetical protein